MAGWIAALLFAAGGSAWLYNVMMKQTGNNTQSSVIVAGIAFVFMFAIFWSILSLIA